MRTRSQHGANKKATEFCNHSQTTQTTQAVKEWLAYDVQENDNENTACVCRLLLCRQYIPFGDGLLISLFYSPTGARVPKTKIIMVSVKF